VNINNVHETRSGCPPRYKTSIKKFDKLLIIKKISSGATAMAA
jgi:hypothetical protein